MDANEHYTEAENWITSAKSMAAESSDQESICLQYAQAHAALALAASHGAHIAQAPLRGIGK